MKKIYLAGCDVFREDAEDYLNELKSLCEKHGFIGLSPFDVSHSFEGKPFSQEHSQYTFYNNVCLIRDCDIIIANIIPFRGACVDDGTAWELGCGFAWEKMLYGYTMFYNLGLKEITEALYPQYKQTPFPVLESFNDNPVNLMIYEAIQMSGGKILETFEDCLFDIESK